MDRARELIGEHYRAPRIVRIMPSICSIGTGDSDFCGINNLQVTICDLKSLVLLDPASEKRGVYRKFRSLRSRLCDFRYSVSRSAESAAKGWARWHASLVYGTDDACLILTSDKPAAGFDRDRGGVCDSEHGYHDGQCGVGYAGQRSAR